MAGTLGGCAAPSRIASPTVRQGEVFCIRGLIDVFSLGMNTLATELRDEGVEAYAVSGPAWPDLARRLANERKGQSNPVPLVLVGHSYGADDALRVAWQLHEQRVRVTLVVLLDATIPPTIPPNVDRCVHLYRSTVVGELFPFMFAGNPVVAAEGNTRTIVENRNLNAETSDPGVQTVGHFNIDEAGSILSRVVGEVLKTCPQREKAEFAKDHRPSPTPTLSTIH